MEIDWISNLNENPYRFLMILGEMMQKGRKADGCSRAWGVLLGAISMYKAWSFSNKKEAGKQKVGKV